MYFLALVRRSLRLSLLNAALLCATLGYAKPAAAQDVVHWRAGLGAVTRYVFVNSPETNVQGLHGASFYGGVDWSLPSGPRLGALLFSESASVSGDSALSASLFFNTRVPSNTDRCKRLECEAFWDLGVGWSLFDSFNEGNDLRPLHGPALLVGYGTEWVMGKRYRRKIGVGGQLQGTPYFLPDGGGSVSGRFGFWIGY